MKRKIFVFSLIIILVMITACGKPEVPKGFELKETQMLGDFTITSYAGKATQTQAEKAFDGWAKQNGWKKASIKKEHPLASYTGTAYERKKELMILQISIAKETATVFTIVGPKDN